MEDRSRQSASRRTITPVAVGVGLVAMGWLIALGTFMWISYYQSYMSDDFSMLVQIQGRSLPRFLAHWYTSWIGRAIPTAFAYLVLSHKWLFALLNTGVLVATVAAIYRLALSRWPRMTLADGAMCTVLLGTLWFGAPTQDQTMMWRVGTFNYSWVLLLGLLFAIPYASFFSEPNASPKRLALLRAAGMFLFGVAVGMSHEQMAIALGWLGVWLLLWAIRQQQLRVIPLRLWSGAVGLVLGLALLVAAPGNAFRLAEEPAWAAADRAGVLQRFLRQAFEVEWAAGYMWLGLLLLLGLGVGSYVAGREPRWRLLTPSFAFFTAALVIVLPMVRVAWSTGPRATYFSFALMVLAMLSLLPLREKPVIDALSSGSLVAIALFVVVLLVADSGFEIRQTRILEKEVRWRRSMIVESQDWGGDMVLPRISAGQRRFQNFGELDPDPTHWRNVDMAKYYEMSSLRVEEEE